MTLRLRHLKYGVDRAIFFLPVVAENSYLYVPSCVWIPALFLQIVCARLQRGWQCFNKSYFYCRQSCLSYHFIQFFFLLKTTHPTEVLLLVHNFF